VPIGPVSRISAGSPGARQNNENEMIETSSKTGSNRRRRLRMNDNIFFFL
jgi:hypothetical protein